MIVDIDAANFVEVSLSSFNSKCLLHVIMKVQTCVYLLQAPSKANARPLLVQFNIMLSFN